MRTSLVALGLIACGLGNPDISAAQPVASPAPHEVVNSIGQKLVLIPAGEFLMGGPHQPQELAQAFPAYTLVTDRINDEYPRHKVRITRPFYMSRHETTVGQFKQFVAATGYKTEAEQTETASRRGLGGWGFNAEEQKFEGRMPKYNWKNPGYPVLDVFPVVNVTWNDAQEFCKWLSKQESQTYRLPSEAEWEYACRGGTTTQYWSGNAAESLSKIANIADRSFFEKYSDYHYEESCLMSRDGHSLPAPVGSFPANPFGLHDMHGNAWEWTNDWYAEDYYNRSPLEDPPGPAQGEVKVRRGGAWHTVAMWARAAFRNYNTVDSRYPNLTFRLVRNAP